MFFPGSFGPKRCIESLRSCLSLSAAVWIFLGANIIDSVTDWFQVDFILIFVNIVALTAGLPRTTTFGPCSYLEYKGDTGRTMDELILLHNKLVLL